MKAPDKIYVPITEGQEIAVNDWSGVPLAQYDWKKVVDNICYIRQDALVEYINKYLAENRGWKEANPSDRFFGGREVALEDLLEKLDTI